MSIENNLKRIADALEKLVEQGNNPLITVSTDPVIEMTSTAAPAPAQPAVAGPTVESTTENPALVPAPAPAPVAETTTAAVTTALTDEAMNAELVAEFKRLGGREQIDIEMTKLGIAGVAGLTADVQNTLLLAIRAIPTPTPAS
jgi:hypothetical protein